MTLPSVSKKRRSERPTTPNGHESNRSEREMRIAESLDAGEKNCNRLGWRWGLGVDGVFSLTLSLRRGRVRSEGEG